MPKLSQNRLIELAALFLKLGVVGFGGPAAHIALMHNETVVRRKWLSDQQFLDLVGATNLIPGPNSTEMAIHIGFLRARILGLITAGVCFIVPAMLIVIALSWAYVRFGSTPQADWLLYFIKPVVIAVIAQALLTLGKKAVKGPITAFVGVAVLALFFAGVNELVLLFAGALVVMLIANFHRLKGRVLGLFPLPLVGLGLLSQSAVPFTFSSLFFTFLKIGSVLFGSGYVLLAFLRADFVVRFGWLTDRQLLDAIAIGQITPGPLFTSATFIGYILAGPKGALLATLGIFLPSFFFVALSNPLIPKIRSSPVASALLDGVNVASLGLMAAVSCQLALSSFADPFTIVIALASFVLLFRFKFNSTWLIAAAALIGLIFSLFH